MKKFLCLLLVLSALCSCGVAEQPANTATEIEATSTAVTEEANTISMSEALDSELFDPITTFTCYSVEEFAETDYCKNMIASGFDFRVLSYDEEKYTLTSISSDTISTWYDFHLIENETGRMIGYTFRFDENYENADDFGKNVYIEKADMVTTAERGEETYEVYLINTVMEGEDNYHLFYIPEEGCYDSMRVSGSASPEVILQYFSEFELVAYAE